MTTNAEKPQLVVEVIVALDLFRAIIDNKMLAVAPPHLTQDYVDTIRAEVHAWIHNARRLVDAPMGDQKAEKLTP